MQRNPGQQERSDESGAANDIDHLLPLDFADDGVDSETVIGWLT